MMQSSGSCNNDSSMNEIKTQLITREGVYRLVQQAQYGRPKPSPYAPHHQANAPNTNSSNLPLVRISFTKFATITTPNTHNNMITNLNRHHQMSHDEINNNGHLTTTPIGSNQSNNYNGNNSSALNDHHETENDVDNLDIDCNVHSHHQHYHHKHHNIASTFSNNSNSNNNMLRQQPQEDQIQERICFNTGRELFVYIFNGLQPSDQTKLVDRKTYKSSPTCHDFCTFVEQRISLLLIGFSHGHIQLIDPYRSEINKYFNQEKLIDKSKVTCIRWLPRSRSDFLVSYSSGQMYLYKEDLPSFTTTPTYQQFKVGEGFIIYTCKTRTTRNPIFRWSIGAPLNNSNSSSNWNTNISNQSAINEFAFSPCGQYLAVVSQDGFLRVFNYDQMELIGRMRSYFGGLLCVGWSPDSKFLVTGGEDDLITVWSLQDKRVIARGQGHKSWVNSVLFDPYMTKTRDQNLDEDHQEDQEDCHNHHHSDLDNSIVDDSIVVDDQRKSKNDEFKLLTNYRIGSVGQDTQICLWDLTDDIIRQSSVIKSRSRSTISSTMANTGQATATNSSTNEYRTSKLLNNLIGGGTMSHHSTISTSNTNSISATSNNQCSTSSNHHHFFNSLKKSGHKKGSSGGFSLSSRSFLDHSRSKNPSSSNKNLNNDSQSNNTLLVSVDGSMVTNSGSSNTNSSTTNTSICDSSRLYGTTLCPRLKEVPMLEPHVCKKVSHERLTSLVFRKDSLVIANHDGKIIIFARPNKSNSINMKISSPNTSMASDVNEIAITGGSGGAGTDDNESDQI